MKKYHLQIFSILAFLSIACSTLLGQNNTQIIRGLVKDLQSEYPLPGVHIVVKNTEGMQIGGGTSIENGQFTIKDIPIGRVHVFFSSIGYAPTFQENILVTSGKQTVLEVKMQESIISLEDITLTAKRDKTESVNEMAIVSVRGFSTDEAFRYAGSRQDPARMAMNFAGVSGNSDARNDIIIRGNSPTGLLWRLEGLDIPSPNHFSSLGSTGGAVSMLNNNTLSNSDFYSAAFPSEYGNALSGVFDLSMRTGNPEDHEFTGQIAFNGFEFGAEGPLGSGATYILNARYSVLSVFSKLGIDLGVGSAVPNYMDYTLKVDIPTQNAGKISIFSIGGQSDIFLKGSDLSEKDVLVNFGDFSRDIKNDNHTLITGVSHFLFLDKNTSIKNTIGFSTSRFDAFIEDITRDQNYKVIRKDASINSTSRQNRITWHSRFSKKINASTDFKIGVIADRYDVLLFTELLNNRNKKELDFNGNTYLAQAYLSWKQILGDFTYVIGGRYQKFFLNDNSESWEPRLSLQYTLTPTNTVSIGYGSHSQLQPVTTYFFQKTDQQGNTSKPNESLGFTKSYQLVIGYDYRINRNFRLKVEAYQQWLREVPIHTYSSSFSMLNYGLDTALPIVLDLTNQGTGTNRGIEITLERFFYDSYYFLITQSLYESTYKGSDNVLRSTAFNGNYNFNALFGKEFEISPEMNFSVDLNYTKSGGRRYTPIDLEASKKTGISVNDESQTFAKSFDAYERLDVRFGFTWNWAGFTQEWALDIQNILNMNNDWERVYDHSRKQIVTTKQLGILPVFLYRITF